MSLETIWQQLEQMPAPQGAGILQRSAYAGVNCAVIAGIQLPGGERILVLRLPEADAQALALTGLTPAIELTLQDDAHAHPGQASVRLRSRDPRHRELFSQIGDDLVQQLKQDPSRPVRALLQRIELWREFLRRRDGPLTELQVRGLYGELWYLHHHLLPRTAARNHLAALAAWTGPLGAARDFHLGEAALDVKTGSPGSSTVHISSIHQLSVPPGARLYLGHVTLRQHASGRSLPKLIDDIRATLGPEGQALLAARLLAAGFTEADRAGIDDLLYSALSFSTYIVRDGFPSLTREHLPPAITDCTYTLDLDLCASFQVDPASVPGIGETHRSTLDH